LVINWLADMELTVIRWPGGERGQVTFGVVLTGSFTATRKIRGLDHEYHVGVQ
jgi:hypothetical protein